MLSILLFLPVYADETQTPLRGGVSPDGKTEIRILGNPGADAGEGYDFGFFKKGHTQPFFRTDVGGGYCTIDEAANIDCAVWDSSGSLVAISDHGTRHSMEIYLFSVNEKRVFALTIPKYGQDLSAKLDFHSGAGSAWCPVPEKWEGNRLFIKLESAAGNAEIVLKVDPSAKNSSKVQLLSETALAEEVR